MAATVLWGLAAWAGEAGQAAAAPGAAGPGALVDAAQAGAAPERASVLAALARVRGDVDAWAVPPAARAREYPWAAGACVTIRFDGAAGVVTVAGQALGLHEGDPARGEVVYRAVAAALRAGEARLPAGRDALRGERAAAVGRAAAVSLELAGEPVPVPAESLGMLETLVVPGLSGLAVRGPERAAAVFPSAMMRAGQRAEDAARALVAEVTGEAGLAVGDLAQVSGARGLRWSTFRVRQAGQADAEARPVVLHRGDVVVPVAAMSRGTVRASAQAIADALGAWAESDGARTGPAAEGALVALALRRFAEARASGGGAEAAGAGAAAALRAVARRGSRSGAAWEDPFAAALVVLADRADGAGGAANAGAEGELGRRCEEAVRAAFTVDAGFAAGLGPAGRGAVAAALASMAGDEATREAARAAVRQGFARTPAGELVGAMPFLGWAELAMAGRQEAVPAASALRQMRERLWQNQVGPVAAGDEREDLVGGVLFADGGAVPTWACLRPIALAATMLREPRLTLAEERAGETARLVYAARFVRQLTVREETAWAPGLAARTGLGWVRTAPGRGDTSAGAGAMGLIVLTELLNGLDE